MNNKFTNTTSRKRPELFILVEASILIALANILSLIGIPFPFGGSITLFSMVPILFLAYKYGIRWGLASGFVYSLLQLLLGWQNVVYAAAAGAVGITVCIVFDYIAAFTVLGFAGVFKKHLKSHFWAMAAGILLTVGLRFVSHLFSGAFIWHKLTLVWEEGNPENMVYKYGPWMYSFIYNIIYMGPELLSSLIFAPFTVKLIKIREDK